MQTKSFNKNLLYQEYARNSEIDPIDKDFILKYFKVRRKRKKWYPEEIENKRRIEQLEYERQLAEQEDSEEIGMRI
jgi:hypothetical protein